jgi:regulatory protein YycH of two-component signal transduction system YycFG
MSVEGYVIDRLKNKDPAYLGKTHAEQISMATDELGALKSKSVQLQALKEKNTALSAMAKEQSNFKEIASINQQIQENLAQIDKLMGFEKTSTIPLVPKDQSKLEVGKKYQSPDGRIGVWNGKGFTPVK